MHKFVLGGTFRPPQNWHGGPILASSVRNCSTVESHSDHSLVNKQTVMMIVAAGHNRGCCCCCCCCHY